ncbi:hypothetical protein B5F40_06390 [Gordonibacter sp. An230]|uniref:helix-turn-helix transcriptional regulator n=1 Tax=Gordonibacter sp. An230 TaxID=1965592 RepID=UPI000B38147F|nr:helix-turn-helix transcriptional regulator [Gordonibacter sp. An230]OUO90582.1 hypothetical protein B5F40_06390 [Gordonibacter sp. An230]
MRSLPHAWTPTRIDHLGQMIPYLFALGCARAWMTLTFATLPSAAAIAIDPHAVFDCAYALVGVACSLASRKLTPLQERTMPKRLALCAMTASSLLVVLANQTGFSFLNMGGAVFGGAGFCLVLLMYSEALVPLSLVRIALYTAASRFVAVPIAWMCQSDDPWRTAFALAILPIVAIACTRHAYASAPAANRPAGNCAFTIPWKPIALLSLYAFVYGLREANLSMGAGIHSSLSTAIVMGVVFVSIYLFSDRFSLAAVCRSPLLLMACGVLLIPTEGMVGSISSGYLISMSYTLVSLLLSLLLYDLSKRLGIAIVSLMGMIKVSALFRVAGAWCAEALSQLGLFGQTHNAAMIAVIVMMVLAGTLMLLPEKEIASMWGARHVDAKNLAGELHREERINERCNELTRTHKLSPREDEVLRLLARGNSNDAIERELFIASGTLKAHIQRIYVKLDVHSRKQLDELFSDVRTESA